MYISSRSAQVRNLAVALVNGALTLVILLIAPLGLMAVVINTVLDPYSACLHQGSERHAALASDLIEEFRAPIVDSLVLYLVNRGVVKPEDFEQRDGGCFLNESGRKKYLGAFVVRMEEPLQTAEGVQPRWDLLMGQVKAFKQFVYSPGVGYRPYLIR